MTVREAYTKGKEILLQKGVPEAELDAWYLLEHVTGISRALYFSDGGRVMDADQEAAYFELVEKRGQRIPLQHLTGVQEFMGFPFRVSSQVLIPRQDTEVLVEEALAVLRKEKGTVRLLDMCTGSGCILLSILKLIRQEAGFGPVYGTGADLSEEALAVAGQNAEILGTEAAFLSSDLFEKIDGRFSMIVSNPPYIRTSQIGTLQEEVRGHDPLMALDGGADGLDFYRRIVREGRGHLLPGGYLMFEVGHDQAGAVAGLMREAGFVNISVKKDLAGLDRVVTGVYDKL